MNTVGHDRSTSCQPPFEVSACFPFAVPEHVDPHHRLEALYRTWCRRVSFDNAMRVLALRAGLDDLPGSEPDDFWAAWAMTGCGGMCVATARALGVLLTAHGFTWRHALARIDDAREPDHLSTIVTLPTGRFLLDTVALGEVPVLLDTGPHRVGHSALEVRSRPTADGWEIQWSTPVNRAVQRCHVLPALPLPDLVGFYRSTQESETFQRFNAMLYARRNTDDGPVVVIGGFAVRVDGDGTVEPIEQSAPDVLITLFGWSERIVTRLEQAGVFG
ncbi:hypothetical protein [Pseudonocardia broussonetiae]|uniref:Arylamine N-acetyltransferase n=1 Tax=Pseudonocardia broussonetiae TaxID=2736640 RepID=A0A6M6JF66_9PSEU|nr:hypothetical protein [Pseudonocardia broussonetiae]QJY45725.1 hypothetical protein HOP40_07875 [Pseudonocardia broussonetiae]